MTYYILQNYWWLIISVLGALLVFLLMVQGGQSMLFSSKPSHRPLLVNSMGRKWELTFTTLVTFGGAFFASFPLFYSTSFGGAYWLWMCILFSFVVQAVAYEYRAKQGNIYGTRFYDVLLLVNGFVGPVLLGVAVAGMFFGAEFTVEKSNILTVGDNVISRWGPLHGFEAMASWKNLLFGVMVFFLARTLAGLYFINNINEDEVREAQRRALRLNAPVFVLLFVAVVVVILVSPGVQVDDGGANPQWVDYKYLHNFVEMWWVLVFFLLGVAGVLWGVGKTLLSSSFHGGIWPAGLGTVLVVLSLFMVVGYNDTAYYPSLLDTASSLSIHNSSSSLFTLRTMSYISILVPFVLAYIAWVWHKMDHGKLTSEELDNTPEHEKY